MPYLILKLRQELVIHLKPLVLVVLVGACTSDCIYMFLRLHLSLNWLWL